MTIFDYISSILFTKKKISTTIDAETEFVPFLVNRWLSMYSSPCAIIANTINRYLSTLNKLEIYNLCVACFDRQPNKKINYFKRKKEELKENNQAIPMLAKTYELSQREVTDYINTLNLNKI